MRRGPLERGPAHPPVPCQSGRRRDLVPRCSRPRSALIGDRRDRRRRLAASACRRSAAGPPGPVEPRGDRPSYDRQPRCAEEFERARARSAAIATSAAPAPRPAPTGAISPGPAAHHRDVLAGEIEAVMTSDDLWRCSGVRHAAPTSAAWTSTSPPSCTRLRDSGAAVRRTSAARSARRPTSPPAAWQARRASTTCAFGMTMARKGHVPQRQGRRRRGVHTIARRRSRQDESGRAAPRARPRRVACRPGRRAPFYAGCALPQDARGSPLAHSVAAGFGRSAWTRRGGRLLRPPQSRGAVAHAVQGRRARLHRLPGLRRQPREAGDRDRAAVGGARRPRPARRARR